MRKHWRICLKVSLRCVGAPFGLLIFVGLSRPAVPQPAEGPAARVTSLLPGLHTGQPGERAKTARELGRLLPTLVRSSWLEPATAALTATMQDKDATVRASTIAGIHDALNGMPEGPELQRLVAVVSQGLKDPSVKVQKCAARALSEVARKRQGSTFVDNGLEGALQPLLKAVGSRSFALRLSAVKAIGWIAASFSRDPCSRSLRFCVEPLARVSESSEEAEEVREQALWALRMVLYRTRDKASWRTMVAAFATALADGDPAVRWDGLRELGDFAVYNVTTRAQAGPLLAPLVPKLVDMLGKDEKDDLDDVAYALGWVSRALEDGPEIARLIEALTHHLDDQDLAVRRQVAWALMYASQRFTDRRVVQHLLPVLEKSVQDPDVELRVWSASALGTAALLVGRKRLSLHALQLLVEILSDANVDRRLRLWAAAGLRDMLRRAESDQVPSATAAALVGLLGECKTATGESIVGGAVAACGLDALPALRAALDSEDPLVRRRAAWVLSRLGSRPYADREAAALTSLLLSSLNDGDVDVRRYAVVALGDVGANITAPRLVAQCAAGVAGGLADDAPGVRAAASGALVTLAWRQQSEASMQTAASALVRALEHNTNDSLGGMLARSLGFVALRARPGVVGPQSIEVVRRLARNATTRTQLLAACGLIGVAAACRDDKHVNEGVTVFLRSMENATASELLAAGSYLGCLACVLPDASVLAPLAPKMERLLDSRDMRARLSGAAALLGIGPALHRAAPQREAMKVLTHFLTDDPVSANRSETAQALARFGPFLNDPVALTEAVHALSLSLTDVEPEVCEDSARALERIDTRQARRALATYRRGYAPR